MSATFTWQRVILVLAALVAIALVLYTLGAPEWTGG